MIHRMTLGKIPAKPHTTFFDENGKLLMEQMVTREGFNGPFTILYYRIPPTDEFEQAGSAGGAFLGGSFTDWIRIKTHRNFLLWAFGR